MADKFQNKYRIPSTRLQHWDYGWNAAYFVTICTKNRECFFGEIENGVMNLSGSGIIADVLWYEIKNHATNIELGAFMVMPNHIHGIIFLNGNNVTIGTGGSNDFIAAGDLYIDGISDNNVETRHALSLQPNEPNEHIEPNEPNNSEQSPQSSPSEPQKTIGQQRFQNQGTNTLSSIIGGYKSGVTKHANRLKLNFAWQSRFHDHIIRDEKSFQNISAYIVNNPQNWDTDQLNT
jgi:REP element-mobilizing transposase RayT